MCGIWALIGDQTYREKSDIPSEVRESVDTLSNRGPEGMKITKVKNVFLGFCRLAINDVRPAGMQPMSYHGLHWVCNGEIYNWKELKSRHGLECSSDSDCSILGPLWERLGKNPIDFFRALDGVFALILYDETKDILVIGRDPYGIRPVFMGLRTNGNYAVGSEMKSLKDSTITEILPGTYTFINTALNLHIGTFKYHQIPWVKNQLYTSSHENGLENACSAVRESLQLAVRKRMMTDRPIAALLSGGVDSSLICALAQQELKRSGSGYNLKTFSIGFEGSPDLLHARMVSEHIGSDHFEIKVTPDDFIQAIPDVIRAIESYDITTVRASIGNWLVSREIKRMTDCKVVFNGDGSDEVFGGYLYFFRSPNSEEFETESERLLTNIHKYDVLRSDRSISSHGLEPRTPFLDKQFVAVARSVDSLWRRPTVRKNIDQNLHELSPEGTPVIEKWILRKAFENTGLLPEAVLWRRKEAFSDGVSSVGKSWYSEIHDKVTINNNNLLDGKYTHLTPKTPEAIYYRNIFDNMYGKNYEKIISEFWMPKWSGETTDPSARTLSLYSC